MSLPFGYTRRRASSSEQANHFSAPDVYYDDEESLRQKLLGHRNRAVSSVQLTCMMLKTCQVC